MNWALQAQSTWKVQKRHKDEQGLQELAIECLQATQHCQAQDNGAVSASCCSCDTVDISCLGASECGEAISEIWISCGRAQDDLIYKFGLRNIQNVRWQYQVVMNREI